MKAAVLNDYGQPLSIEEVRIDAPRAGEVKVRIGATGVCHSDYHLIKGEWKYGLPMILGHEAAGVVEEVGAGVTSVQPGDHAILSFRPACGTCRLCTLGRSVMCEGYSGNRFMMHDGTARVHRNGEDLLVMARMGSFAEYVVMAAEQVIPVRKDVSMEVLALIGCAVTTGVGAVINAAKVEPGSSVAVFGCGGVGLNAIQAAALMGAGKVIAVDVFDQKLEWSREFGATHLVNATKEDPVERIHQLCGRGGADYAIEAIGGAKTIEQAFAAVHRGGTVIIIGVSPADTRLSIDPQMLLQERILTGSSFGGSRQRVDLPMFVDLFMEGKYKLRELISQEIELEDLNRAYEELERGEVRRSVVVYR